MPVKVTQKVTELIDADITFVSLVGKGANKRAFTILKAEDGKEEPVRMTLIEKLSGLLTSQEIEGPAKVSAIICANTHVALAEQVLKENGLSLEDRIDTSKFTLFKQPGYDPAVDGTTIALNEDVLVQFDRVIKRFDSFPESTDFDENLVAGGFFPGVRSSLETLGDTIFEIMFSSDESSDATSLVSTALSAFSSHVNGLVTNLPVTVFKMDAEGFNKQENLMTLAADIAKGPGLSETMAGDLGGLLDEPVQTTEKAPDDKTAIVEKEAGADETTADSADSSSDEEVNKTDATDKTTDTSEATGSGVTADADADKDTVEKGTTDPMAVIAASIEANTVLLTDVADTLKKQSDRIDALETKTEEVEKKANRPVIVNHGVVNEQLATINGHKPVQKHDASADDGVWGGLMNQLTEHASG